MTRCGKVRKDALDSRGIRGKGVFDEVAGRRGRALNTNIPERVRVKSVLINLVGSEGGSSLAEVDAVGNVLGDDIAEERVGTNRGGREELDGVAGVGKKRVPEN